MFESINTIAIYVTDLEKAKKFYTEILGFEISVQVAPNLCFLKSKSGRINIYLQGDNKPVAINNNSCRLSFFLKTKDSIFKSFEILKSAGVKLLQKQPEQVGDDTYVFQFEDLDGNILEVTGKS